MSSRRNSRESSKNAGKILKKGAKKSLNLLVSYIEKVAKQLTLSVPSMYMWEAFLLKNKAVLEKNTVSQVGKLQYPDI